MRQLLPDPVDNIDAYDVYRTADPFAPLLRLNMVSSADGSATDLQGRSGGLGGEGDLEILRTLRALADGIIVGAGTAQVEHYGPHRLSGRLAERRQADGRPPAAPIVVISRSLELDLGGPMFTEVAVPTIVLTCAASPPDRRAGIESAGGRLLVVGTGAVDLGPGLQALRDEFGLNHLLCEGGPTLNRQLFAEGLVDELCLTLAPKLIGGDSLRIVSGLPAPMNLDLDTLCEHGGELFLRYRVR